MEVVCTICFAVKIRTYVSVILTFYISTISTLNSSLRVKLIIQPGTLFFIALRGVVTFTFDLLIVSRISHVMKNLELRTLHRVYDIRKLSFFQLVTSKPLRKGGRAD